MLTETEINMMRATGCPWLYVAKLPHDRYWRVYTGDAAEDGSIGEWSGGYTGGYFATKAAATAYAMERCEDGSYHGFGHASVSAPASKEAKVAPMHSEPVTEAPQPTEVQGAPLFFHYRSLLRPVTQFDLRRLDWEFCEAFVCPEPRDMLTRRQLTEWEVSQLSLQFVGMRAA